MTPTLLGRWQIRIFLLATVGLIISLVVGLIVKDFVTPLFALLYVFLFGVLWDLLYPPGWEAAQATARQGQWKLLSLPLRVPAARMMACGWTSRSMPARTVVRSRRCARDRIPS